MGASVAEDEFRFIAAAVVAERLWLSTRARKDVVESCAAEKVGGEREDAAALTDCWVFKADRQSLPPVDHGIWEVMLEVYA